MAFQADPPTVYLAKVKNLLVGLPPTSDEVAAVTADPTQLKPLIQGWMQLPQYATKMQRFFELAFQQTQVTSADFADQVYPKQIDVNGTTTPLLLQNLQESFARTMLALIAAGQPLTAATTTNQLMMTTALKELYAFLDVWEVDDNGTVTDRFKKANPKLQITVETGAGPIPIAETLDPTSANYMHWYDPDAATEDASIAGCAMDPIVYPAERVHAALAALRRARRPEARRRHELPAVGRQRDRGAAHGRRLHRLDAGDHPPPEHRRGVEHVLRSAGAAERDDVGPVDPARRVLQHAGVLRQLADQHQQPDAGDDEPDVDRGAGGVGRRDRSDHAADQPAARARRRARRRAPAAPTATSRSIRRARSSPPATPGTTTTSSTRPGRASRASSSSRGSSSRSPAWPTSAARWPRTRCSPPAWVEKLCYYANSEPCDAADPEFQRLVSLFQASNYSWNTLVAELFASPLTTNATPTETTTAHGEVVAVSRRDHLCAALDNRLGLDDVCGLKATTKKQMTATVPQIVSGLPSDGYGRGSTIPVLPNQPSLFYRAATENICAAVAAQVIDVAGRQADRRRDLLVEQRSRRCHRRLRLDGDGAGPVRSALRRGEQPPARPLHGGDAAGRHGHGRAAVDLRRGVPGAVRGLDRNVGEGRGS